jgi:hypothetical protein
MPQWIADGDDIGSRSVEITLPQFLGKGPRRFGSNLDCALGNAAKAVALPVGLEALAYQLSRKAFDFITHVKQPYARACADSHQKICTASRSTSARMYGESASRVE